MKKYLRYILYAFCLFILLLLEKSLGLRAFSVGFLLALIYCRENTYVLLLLYASLSMAVFRTVENLYFCLTPCLIIVIASFIHYKTKKKMGILPIAVYAFLSEIPIIVFGVGDIYQFTNTIISIVGTQIFTYLSIMGLYPVLVRELRFRLKPFEGVALAGLLAVFGMGLAYLNILIFPLYYALALYISLLAQVSFKNGFLPAVILGMGGALARATPELCVYMSAFGMCCKAFSDLKEYLLPIACILAYLLINLALNMGFELFELLSILLACLLFYLTPKRVKEYLIALRPNFASGYASRTLINRDRAEISKRLKGLAAVFFDMQNVLGRDLSHKKESKTEINLANEISSKCCRLCGNYALCGRELSGNLEGSIRYIVKRGLQAGKLNILDVPPAFGSLCRRMNTFLTISNEVITKYNAKKDAGESLDYGREMVSSQMGGMGLLLDKLAEETGIGLTYDTEREKSLMDKLCNSGINAVSAVIYNNQNNQKKQKLTLIVKKVDAEKRMTEKVVSDFFGVNMQIIHRENSIKGTQTMYFEPSSRYAFVYGEKVFGKKESDAFGDSAQVVKISSDKIMLALSDGMGSGREAEDVGRNTLLMLEGFYKAGFDHNTILNCTGKLLSARGGEEFSALDVAVIDLESAFVDFIKQGGRESFILRSSGDVEVIECGSLPLGIIEDALPIIERKQLFLNDILVLLSDGVIDSIGRDGVIEIISGVVSANPQTLAELLVNNAVNLSKKSDDCSCIVGRIILK